MGGLAPGRDEVREEKRKDTEGTRARERWRDAMDNEKERKTEREREGRKSYKRYKEGVKKRVVRKNE